MPQDLDLKEEKEEGAAAQDTNADTGVRKVSIADSCINCENSDT